MERTLPMPSTVAQAILGTLITVGFFVAMFLPVFSPSYEVDETLKTTLVTIFTLVVGYYFGSSQGSAKKDETIHAVATSSGTGGGLSGPDFPSGTKDDPVAVTEVPSPADSRYIEFRKTMLDANPKLTEAQLMAQWHALVSRGGSVDVDLGKR